MRLYIDINTGYLKRNVDNDGALLGPLILYLKNVLPLEIVFVDGTTSVTTTVLAGGALLKVGLKAQPGATTLLALASSYTLNDEVAVLTLNLNTTELIAYFAANITAGIQSASLFFEVQVTAADESETVTYHQSRCVVNRNVNSGSDVEPTGVDTALYVLKAALFDGNGLAVSPHYVGFRGEITGLTGGTAGKLDNIVTTTLVTPTVFAIKIAGAGGQLWALEAGVDAEDGEWIVHPDDHNALTNAKVWKRIL